MNGPIEVSGEANPLTTQTLFRVLTSASSTHQQQVKTGAQQLQNWEKQPGFYSSLQVKSPADNPSVLFVANTSIVHLYRHFTSS